MKKAIFSLFFILSLIGPGAAYSSDCQSALLGSELDSNSFFLSEDKFNKSMDESDSDFALDAIAAIRNNVGCIGEVVAASQVKCREVIEADASSKVCVVEAPEGMFFIISDFMGNARVVYNRWD